MSIAAMDWAWRQAAVLSSGELVVLLAYADYASDEGTAWPKNSTVAEKVNMNPRSIRRIVAALESKGLVRRIVNEYQGLKHPIPPGKRPNVLLLNVGGQFGPPTEDWDEREDEPVPPREDEPVPPREDEPVLQNRHYEPPLEPSAPLPPTRDPRPGAREPGGGEDSTTTMTGSGPTAEPRQPEPEPRQPEPDPGQPEPFVGEARSVHQTATARAGYPGAATRPGDIDAIAAALARGHTAEHLVDLGRQAAGKSSPLGWLGKAWRTAAGRDPDPPAGRQHSAGRPPADERRPAVPEFVPDTGPSFDTDAAAVGLGSARANLRAGPDP